MRKILVILSIILLASCTNKANISDNPLINNMDNMANILFDIHITESLEKEGFVSKTDVKMLYTNIFKKHGVTTEQFDSATVYYHTHNKEHIKVYEKVTKKLNEYLALSSKDFFIKYPAENINIWKDYAVFPKGLQKFTQFLPFYICPKPEYLNKLLIIKK